MQIPKPPTRQQIEDFQNHIDDVWGSVGPIDPEDINVAREVDELIKLYSFDEGAEFAAFRSENALFKEDQDDWREVARIIRESKAGEVLSK